MKLKDICWRFLALSLFVFHIHTAVAQSLDFKLRILDKKEYSGIVIGKVFFIEANIKNMTNTPLKIGDYFRVLMNERKSEWAIFSMGARSSTNLKTKDVRHLAYGSGSASLALLGENGKSMQISFPQSNDVINDQTDKLKSLKDMWPEKISGNQSVIIQWPTFWFSDTQDSPVFWASPSFESGKEKTYYWVGFNDNKARQIKGDKQTLKDIITNSSEPIGLRSAAVRWLLEANRKEEKFLLQFIETGRAPITLAYRCIQALMVWGSDTIIDDVFDIWKHKKIEPELDKYIANYFSWSDHINAAKAAEKIKTGAR